MCLVHLNLNNHPEYKLILAANRDEIYNRPTEPLHYWDDAPHILAGRDLKGMGTWLGVRTDGRIALLTNIRNKKEMRTSYEKSRGGLVSGFLESNQDPEDYLNTLKPNAGEYAGFNLITGYPDELYYMNNYENKIIPLTPGIHGLSNHRLDTPWPKVIRGNHKLEQISQSDVTTEAMFQMMNDRTKADDDKLPDTGVSKALESELSPMFINMNEYGTRCTTVLTVTYDNQVTLSERTYKNGKVTGTVSFQYHIKAAD